LENWRESGLILSGMYRSRLAKLEEKRNLRRAVVLVVIMIGLVGGGVVWGVPFLVKVAMFAGAFGSAGQQIDKSDLIPPAPPMVQVDFEATNSARLALRGWTEPGAEVFLVHNLEPAGSVIAREDGGFLFEEIMLSEGDNEFSTVAVDQGENESQPSTAIRVFFSQKAPKLEIEQPSDGQLIRGSTPRVEIKGMTDDGARVTVNERLVVLGQEGKFSTFVGLQTGDNHLTVLATDRAGNQSRKELVVKYEP